MLPADGGPDDCELLRRMADDASERSARREAWGVFYERHAEYVYRKCAAAHSRLIGIENVTDAVSDTFLRAYEKSATFRLSGAPAEVQERIVRAWLLSISENIIRDHFRNSPKIVFAEEPELDDREDVRDGTEHLSVEPQSAKSALVEEGLKQLSDREQRVLRETVFWYVPGARYQRMPHAAMASLAKELNTTPSNIRQIRVRALETLRQYILARS
jgi:RNA polymerase sigma factor (sigma-70 family)